jgi:hypothetical protein
MTRRKQPVVDGDQDRTGDVGRAAASGTASAKDAIASELGRRGGLKGGPARAERMTGGERSQAARRAANARWHPQAVERLAAHDHAAHVYTTGEDRVERIAEFLHAGLTAGDRCLYVADRHVIADIIRALGRRSVNVDVAVASDRLLLLTTDEVYVRDGRFDPMHTSRFWSEFLRGAQQDDASGLRAAADMGWVADVGMTPRDLRDYETSINASSLIAAGARTICQFDRRRFTPDALHAVLQTHRVVFVDGVPHLNPFFEPPEVIDRGPGDDARITWMIDQLRQSSPPAL